jgi:hypothetical protein
MMLLPGGRIGEMLRYAEAPAMRQFLLSAFRH